MRVLIVGGSGVISRAIVRQCVELGYDTTVYNRGLRKAGLPENVTQLTGDRMAFDQFERDMSAHQFDAVIDMISFNVDGARSLLRAFGGRTNHIIVCSTSSVYDRPFHSIPTREETETLTTLPDFPYGFNKAEMERYLQPKTGAQPDAKGTPITIIRPSLTFGEGSANFGVFRQNYNIIDRMRKGKALISFGDGKAPWSFTFAPDLARGFVLALNRPSVFGKAYHVASEERAVWDDLYRAFGTAIGCTPLIRHMSAEFLEIIDPGLCAHLVYDKSFAAVFDCSAFRHDVPGWKVNISLKDGTAMIADWFLREAATVDTAKDELEDTLVNLWEKWAGELRSLKR